MNRKVWDCDRQGQATHIFLYTSILGVGNRAVNGWKVDRLLIRDACVLAA